MSADDETCLAYLGELSEEQKEKLKGRMILVKKAKTIPIECVVRGFLTGSLWKSYQKALPHSEVLGHKLPSGLKESQELPIPIFTPSTKTQEGHDINLTYEEMENHLRLWLRENPDIQQLMNAELLAQNLRSTSLVPYLGARDYAKKRGIIIADTKFEFGFVDGKITLIDEVLTPDSSRFWPADSYQPGQPQESFDKQYLRDWLDNVFKWNHESSAPELPEEVVEKTQQKYWQAFQRLTQ